MAHVGCPRGRARFQFQEMRNQDHRNRSSRDGLSRDQLQVNGA